jgi:hypothetical protein
MLNKITDKFLEHMPIVPCQEATRLLSKAMDCKLSLKEHFHLQVHLLVCDLCVRFATHVHALRKAMRHYTSIGEQHLAQPIKDQMKQTLRRAES